MERGGMHYFLYRWGVETGRIIPNPRRVQSYLVAQVFAREPETVKAAARGYWYECIKAVKCA